MEQLPENNYDKAIIRLLGSKEWPILDFDNNKNFLRLFNKERYGQKANVDLGSAELQDDGEELTEYAKSEKAFQDFFNDQSLKYGRTH